MPDLDFAGLNEAAQTAFKPHFSDVLRREARRRRRTRMAGAALALAAVTVGGAAVVLPGGATSEFAGPVLGPEPTTNFMPAPEGTPAPGQQRSDGPVKTGAMVVGDLDHLYVRWHDCRSAADCALMVAASADGGVTWRSYPLPVGRNAMVDLRAVGPRTLVAWAQSDLAGEVRVTHTWHASTDGGATWREVRPRTVAAVPTGWRVLPGFDYLGPGQLIAVDPAAGDVVALPSRPLALVKSIGGLPPAAGLWMTGYLHTVTAEPPNPAQPDVNAGRVIGTGTTVEVSRNGGRTWKRYTFPEDLVAGDDGAVAIATEDGRTVYAVGRAGTVLRVYRSLDGGGTWQRMAGQHEVGARPVRAAIGRNGRLAIQAGPEGSEPTLMFESVDGGATIREIPDGPGASAVRVPGGYAQSGWPWSSGAWLSPDGTQWSFVDPPKLP